MQQPYIPKLSIDVPSALNDGLIAGGVSKSGMPALTNTSATGGPSFKDFLGNAVNGLNDVVTAPDALMQQYVTGGPVDVHDIMIANAKAELAVNLTAQIATKVSQAYDKILQIQI